MKRIAVLVVALAGFAAILPSVSNAQITTALGIPCGLVPAGPDTGQRQCGSDIYNPNQQPVPVDTRSTVQSFDGVPIDVNVAFPSTGGDGPYPLVMMFHGYGGGKASFSDMQRWLNKGYAVLSQTNRGFHESCGTTAAKAADPDCLTKGFVRLDDTRYEVRDAQVFAGRLVDEGLVLPSKIAATGGSYGGGMSMALAAPKDRMMMPDGTLVPWQSPNGTAMSLAVAIPNIPWTDLAYSLVPNGSNVDYVKDSVYKGRFGVMKQSYINGLYLTGITSGEGYYTAPGVEPSADLTGWKAFMDLGEPYDGKAQATQMINEIQSFHSSYFINHSVAPAPLMISSGFTDDLFPANEATRFYNRTRAEYPNTPLGLFFGDFGHPRAANKADVRAALMARENAWVDYYLAGTGTQPASDVVTYTQTCPSSSGTLSGGPYTSSDWASQSPGEIVVEGGPTQTIDAASGDPLVATAWNPGQLSAPKPCVTAAGAEEPGTANYETAPASAAGYTIMGSPTVIAKIAQAGDNSQIAARLVDASADGTTKVLINRALWRPANSGYQVFQLNPNGWKVEEGHVVRLELLSKDAGGAFAAPLSNYGRPSNDQQPATIENLELRLPVVESPGALNGLVKTPAKKVLPNGEGVELARGYEAYGSETALEYGKVKDPCPAGTHGSSPPDCTRNVIGNLKPVGSPTVKGKTMTIKVTCKVGNDSCKKASIVVQAAGKVRGLKKPVLAKGKGIKATPGQTKKLQLKLTAKARKLFKDSRKRGKKVKGIKKVRAIVKINGKRAGAKTVRKVGKVR